jgi:AraC-like DNA-binding protein
LVWRARYDVLIRKLVARQRRLQKARRMLEGRDTIQTATSVAFVCGFNDVGHFSREFSKAFGEVPSAVLDKRPR